MGNAITNEVDKYTHYLRITEVALPADAIDTVAGVYLTLQCNGNRTAATVGVSKDGRIIFRSKENKFLVRNSELCTVTCEFSNAESSGQVLGSGSVEVSRRNGASTVIAALRTTGPTGDTAHSISVSYRNEERYTGEMVSNEYIQIASNKIDYLDRLHFPSAIEAAKMASCVYLGYTGDNPEDMEHAKLNLESTSWYRGKYDGIAYEYNNSDAYPWAANAVRGGLAETVASLNYRLLKFSDSDVDGEAMVAMSCSPGEEGKLVVAFRGTEPNKWKDALADIDLDLVPWVRDPKCKQSLMQQFSETDVMEVSCGVLEQLDSLMPCIFEVLDFLVAQRMVKKLVVVGHSLGGALCHMGTVRILERYITERLEMPFKLEVYTFGAQRMCNTAFQQWSTMLIRKIANATAFRFVNDYDVVPTVPPFLGGHRHGGGQLITLKDKEPDFEPLEWLTDHLMGNYIAQLDRVAAVPLETLKTFKAVSSENWFADYVPYLGAGAAVAVAALFYTSRK